MSGDDIALVIVSVAFGIFLVTVGISIVISTVNINKTMKAIKENISEEEADE